MKFNCRVGEWNENSGDDKQCHACQTNPSSPCAGGNNTSGGKKDSSNDKAESSKSLHVAPRIIACKCISCFKTKMLVGRNGRREVTIYDCKQSERNQNQCRNTALHNQLLHVLWLECDIDN